MIFSSTSSNNNSSSLYYYYSHWSVASIPLHQSWALNPSTNFPVGAVKSGSYSTSPSATPFTQNPHSFFPRQYENCSFAYEEDGKTILTSPDVFNTNRYSTSFRLADTTLHICLVCQHEDRVKTPAQSARDTFSKNNFKDQHLPKTLVCFQIHEFTDGSIAPLMPESQRLDVSSLPMETIESMQEAGMIVLSAEVEMIGFRQVQEMTCSLVKNWPP